MNIQSDTPSPAKTIQFQNPAEPSACTGCRNEDRVEPNGLSP